MRDTTHSAHASLAERLGRLLIVGGGKMGEAVLSGLISSRSISADAVTVANPGFPRREYLTAEYGVECVAKGSEVLPADTVLLAVKPQIIDSVVRDLAATGKLDGTLVISIAVGVSCERLEALLPESCIVIRVMPNTPALVGCGVSVVSGGHRCDEFHVELVRELFASFGTAVVLDEKHQNAAGAISGAGPAYFALIVDALSRAGVRHGLPRAVAQELAVETMRGTATLIAESGEHPQVVIDAVTSPGGTTIAGIEAMEAYGLRTALAEGVTAAVERSEELA